MENEMKYCKKCVYPFSAVNLHVEDDGICASCKTFEAFEKIKPEFWIRRRERLNEIIAEMSVDNHSDYDCLIPVSGGKDSYFQTHIITKELGLKPLLMTYHGNNFLPEGDYN